MATQKTKTVRVLAFRWHHSIAVVSRVSATSIASEASAIALSPWPLRNSCRADTLDFFVEPIGHALSTDQLSPVR